MWFESLLVFILFKFKKKRSNISGIRVVQAIAQPMMWRQIDVHDLLLAVATRWDIYILYVLSVFLEEKNFTI